MNTDSMIDKLLAVFLCVAIGLLILTCFGGVLPQAIQEWRNVFEQCGSTTQ